MLQHKYTEYKYKNVARPHIPTERNPITATFLDLGGAIIPFNVYYIMIF